MSPSDAARLKAWRRELSAAMKKPRVLIAGPDYVERCIMCGCQTKHWLMPENAPICTPGCMRVYLKDPTVYDPRGLYGAQSLPKKIQKSVDTLAIQRAGIEALRSILKRLRDDAQGGYSSYEGNGEWSFASTSLPQTTPEQLNALFALAGLEPDVIVPKGSCGTCIFATNGRERGWSSPCCSCSRPLMSNFVPEKGFKRE